jgi:hypothetical protein
MAVETLASMDKASPFFFFPADLVFSPLVEAEVGDEVAVVEELGLEGFLFGTGDTSEGCSVFVVLDVLGRN